MNQDIVETRTFGFIAEEIVTNVKLDWSSLYALDDDSRMELRDEVVSYFIKQKPSDLTAVCPNLCEYMLANQRLQDWHSIAIAVDNLNGMYHPLRLTKMVIAR